MNCLALLLVIAPQPIHLIRVLSQRLCARSLSSIVSKRRLELIRKNKMAAVKLGGVTQALAEVTESLQQSRNILLSGASGCGKTSLVTRAVANIGLPCLVTDCSTLARKVYLISSSY